MSTDSTTANYPAFLQALAEKLHLSGRADTVFGEPREVAGRTFIPVARVAYGLGGGYGKPVTSEGGDTVPQSGGGGIQTTPIGAIEITPSSTRFIPTPTPAARLLALLAAAVAAGVLLGRAAR
ncbi:GerW family sporulation protein [Naasia sp. SYSU D00948]|uniref:GerW family sporulation protein n=1 Tax=Naasia sp. SYSU D00948 TaxID=2817379 RepID=UPI001B30A685|nr:spore germination protein GerW family protein [Naasia sp. SYSU D00948]